MNFLQHLLRSGLPAFFVLFFILGLDAAGQPEDAVTRALRLQTEAGELLKASTADATREAVEKLVAAEALWKEAGRDRERADTIKPLIKAPAGVSEVKRSLEYALVLEPLAESLGDQVMRAETLFDIGVLHDMLGETMKGMPYVENAITFFEEMGDAKRLSVALNAGGQLYSNIGEMKKALELLERSLTLRRQIGDQAGEAVTLANLGTIYDDTGRKRDAVTVYTEALRIMEARTENKDLRNIGVVLNNLGRIYQELGEFQKALDHYEQALAARRAFGNKQGEAVTLVNIGSLYRLLGELETTLELLRQSLAIYQDGGFRRNEARTLASIASVVSLQGNDAEALKFYQKALEIDRAIGNKLGESWTLHGLAIVHERGGRPLEALPLLEEGIRISRETDNPDTLATLTLVLAKTYSSLGRMAEAEQAYGQAVNIYRDAGMPGDIAEALYHSARFDQRQGRTADAMTKMTEVLEIVEDLRVSIAAHNLRSSFFADQQAYFDFYISQLAARHQDEPEAGHDAAALGISERARARSLLESLGEAKRDIRSGVDNELLERENILRQTISSKELHRVEALRQRSSVRADELEKELVGLVLNYRDVQTLIRRQSPQLAGLANPVTLDLAQIQSQVIDEDSILLEYAVGVDRSYLFAVTRSDIEVIELPNSSVITTLTRDTLENMKARGRTDPSETAVRRQARIRSADTELDRQLKMLSDMLIGPVAKKIKDKRLLVVASGALHYFPFAALRSPEAAGREPLIVTNEIVNLPSASVVPLLRRPREADEERIAISIIADPVFSADDTRLKAIARQAGSAEPSADPPKPAARPLPTTLRSEYSRLRFSRSEASAISAYVPAAQRMVALDFAANLDAAAGDDIGRSRIVHFATHGTVNSQFPELSGLVFSLVDESGNSRNGFLRLSEIYNLRLDADLVVLSACETALGKEVKGEGIVGLTRGMMYAGAPSVLATLWRVEDKATADLMKIFYKGVLKDGQTPAAAIRSAQAVMLKNKGSAHPFYWAGFSLQGDWRGR